MIPKKFLIQNISGREVLDSRGFPTLEVEVCLGSGVVARAGVPAGTSTGSHEALELRDGEVGRFKGKGVLKAVRNVEKVNKVLMSKDVRGQEGIDASLLVADGTEQKANLGANTMLGVSLACARAAAVAEGLQLYEYLGHLYREEELGRKVESAKHAPYRSGASGAGHPIKIQTVQIWMFNKPRLDLHTDTHVFRIAIFKTRHQFGINSINVYVHDNARKFGIDALQILDKSFSRVINNCKSCDLTPVRKLNPFCFLPAFRTVRPRGQKYEIARVASRS